MSYTVNSWWRWRLASPNTNRRPFRIIHLGKRFVWIVYRPDADTEARPVTQKMIADEAEPWSPALDTACPLSDTHQQAKEP